MAITIKFDTANMAECPTLILAKRSGVKIGSLNYISQIHLTDYLNSAAELSFTVNKFKDGRKTKFWKEIRDFRLLYIPEWEKWFELRVEIDEENTRIKNVTAKSLCEAELSQLLLIETEINTEADIARKDYVPTVLYNPDDKRSSLLDRILSDKGRHYTILHVDSTIKNIQRTFSFDGVSIYDACQKIAEEIHCLFVFGEIQGKPGKHPYRTISVYDLESNCNHCGHRGEFTEKCPQCESTDINEGYGEDTSIFVSVENLAENIVYETDVDSVKNCFRLKAGDDLMTATVINTNPAGTPYLWYITDYMKADMSEELLAKLEAYDKDYAYYQNEHKVELDPVTVDKYNALIEKYRVYDEKLELVTSPMVGYQQMAKIYYDTVDFAGYLRNTLMPTIKMVEKSAAQQASLLNSANLSPVSLEQTKYISLATANSAVLAYAKVYIDTARFRVKVKDSELEGTTWRGNFTVTSYSDDEDTTDSAVVTVVFNDDYENFIKQKIDKLLEKENSDDYDIVALFKKDDEDFKAELKKYCLNYLNIFYDACQGCLDVMIEQGIADKDSWNTSSNPEANPYDSLYLPYLKKSEYINEEMMLREEEINIVIGKYDMDGTLIEEGLQSMVLKYRNEISNILNFEKYIGEYWDEFCTFRREDIWQNDNYISDGLTNAEMCKKAAEFIEAAKKELYKSATLQHSISTTLKNLLLMKPFESLRDSFSVGNWLRLMVDENVYKLRLVSYSIDYDNLDTISVDFSDALEQFGAMSDVESILKQSQSMGTSYSSVKKQTEKNKETGALVGGWVKDGLDATTTKIVNSADNQSMIFDKHGLSLRKYDDITGTYSLNEAKFINTTLAFTTDGWKTSKAAIGKFIYFDPKDKQEKTGYGVIANQLIGNIILSEEMGIYNKSGSMTFDTEGLNISNGKNRVVINPNADKLFTISKNNENIFYVDNEGNLNITGRINAGSGSKLGIWSVTDTAIYSGSDAFGTAGGKYFGDAGLSISNKFKVDENGNITASGKMSLAGGGLSYDDTTKTLTFSGKISAGSGSSFGYWVITDTAIYNGSPYWGNANGKYFGSSGLSISDKFKVDANGNVTSSGTLNFANGQLSYKPGGDCSFGGVSSGTLSGVSGTFTNLTAGNSYFCPTWVSIDADGQGAVRIGTPDYKNWVDITIKPSIDNKGNIGTPDNRWSTLYSRVIAEGSARNTKEEVQTYDIEHAYDELRHMPLYTYFYKDMSPESRNMSIGTMIDYIPSEVMMTTPDGNDSFNLGNLEFWHLAASQVMQRKIEEAEEKIKKLESLLEGMTGEK